MESGLALGSQNIQPLHFTVHYLLYTGMKMEFSPYTLSKPTSPDRRTVRLLLMSSSSTAQVTGGYTVISCGQADIYDMSHTSYTLSFQNNTPCDHRNRFPFLRHTSLAAPQNGLRHTNGCLFHMSYFPHWSNSTSCTYTRTHTHPHCYREKGDQFKLVLYHGNQTNREAFKESTFPCSHGTRVL